MDSHYTTGKFAKLANITNRTIRFYDKIGLLKPSFIMENGYRQYSDQDFLKLQKIMSLKYLGFSLDEIKIMIENEGTISLADTFDFQIDLANKKINNLKVLKEALKHAKSIASEGELEWNQIINLIRLLNKDDLIVEQYRNTRNLLSRIKLHETYSTSKEKWFPWLLEQIDFSKVNKLLELGCGNGELWKHSNINMRNRDIYLSDSSEGMIDDVRKELNDEYNFFVIDCENIPFKKDYFDAIVANHVLFYVNDLNRGLSEIVRVLKDNGILYCTTYGSNHMKEISEIVKAFDNQIELSQENLYDHFGLENGSRILDNYFSEVIKTPYEDSLEISEAKPLLDYIVSAYGNQNEILVNRYYELEQFIENKIKREGTIHISKEVGLYICKKS